MALVKLTQFIATDKSQTWLVYFYLFHSIYVKKSKKRMNIILGNIH